MKYQIDAGASFVLSILCQQVAIQYRFWWAPAGNIQMVSFQLRPGKLSYFVSQSRCSLLVRRRLRWKSKQGDKKSAQLHCCNSDSVPLSHEVQTRVPPGKASKARVVQPRSPEATARKRFVHFCCESCAFGFRVGFGPPGFEHLFSERE